MNNQMKLAKAVLAFKSGEFASAFAELQTHFTKYLTQDQIDACTALSSQMEAKTEQLTKVIQSLAKDTYFVNFRRPRTRYSASRTPVATIAPDGKVNFPRDIFGSYGVASEFQNATLFASDDDSFVDDWSSNIGIGDLIRPLMKDIPSYQNNFCGIAIKKSKVKKFQKYFDVKDVIDVTTLITEERARRKAERANKPAVPRDTVRCFKTSDNMYSYDELKVAANGLKIVLHIIKRDSPYSTYVCTVNKPVSLEAEKRFILDEITPVRVYNNAWEIESNYDVTGYFLVSIAAGDYKRLKLWRDEDLMLDYDFCKKIISEHAAKIKPVKRIIYRDNILADDDNLSKRIDAFEAATPDSAKETAFYKRLQKAWDVIKTQKAILSQREYTHLCTRDLVDYNIQSPVVEVTMDSNLFKDYPIVEYFNASIRLWDRLWGANGAEWHVVEDNFKNLLDYVNVIEKVG